MRRLIGTALILGFALTWRPEVAAGQYSWSSFSLSVGVGFGLGLSYTSVEPWYEPGYSDPCWDYAYYDWYPYCGNGYYGAGYAYDYGHHHYDGRRFASLFYGYNPWRFSYPAYWGYGWGYPYWGGTRLSFGSLYPYDWFGYGNYRGGNRWAYGNGAYGYYNNRAASPYRGPHSTIATLGNGRGRAINGTGYKESPRSDGAQRLATNRGGTAAPSANSAARSDVSATAARSAQRNATAGRAMAPMTRTSADRAAGSRAVRVRPTATRARPSDALQGRSAGRATVSRARAPSRTGSGSRAAAPARRSGGATSAQPSSPGFRAPAALPSSGRSRAPVTRSAPSRNATPSARTTRAAPSRPSTRPASPSRARSAPRSAPSRARSAPSSSTRRAPTRSAPSRSSARSARPPTRSAAPSRSPGRSSVRSVPRGSSSARSAPSRSGGSSGRSRAVVRRPRGG